VQDIAGHGFAHQTQANITNLHILRHIFSLNSGSTRP
jgi:hypothetical protein